MNKDLANYIIETTRIMPEPMKSQFLAALRDHPDTVRETCKTELRLMALKVMANTGKQIKINENEDPQEIVTAMQDAFKDEIKNLPICIVTVEPLPEPD